MKKAFAVQNLASTVPPSPRSLAGLVALGVLSALWALFLWAELVASRLTGAPVCALGDPGRCTALWDSPFASGVHRATGVPLAGWGTAWGLVAFALPLLLLLARAEGRGAPGLFSAVRVTAGAGVLAVLALAGVSAAARAFCPGCLVMYLLVAGYAGVALLGWKGLGLPDAGRGFALAASLTAAAILLLLYPGLRTPHHTAEAAREAIVSASAAASAAPSHDAELRELVAALDPRLRQSLSDALAAYGAAPRQEMEPPRTLLGPADAPVRITEFTDVLCEHCADLHRTIESLREHTPAGSFSVEPRQFPLDARCNPLVTRRGKDDVRCLAARARICLEGHERAFELSGALFANQQALTEDRVYELAAPYMPRPDLERCVKSAATRGKLEADVAAAARFQPEGTPLVIVNGRRASAFGPFLYAMILSGGEGSHPAFAALPSPSPAPPAR